MRRNRCFGRSRGLSLTELLVVMGVALALIVPLGVSAERGFRRSKAVQCMANLRQIAQGVELFAIENRRLPVEMENLPQQLAGYVDAANAFRCPCARDGSGDTYTARYVATSPWGSEGTWFVLSCPYHNDSETTVLWTSAQKGGAGSATAVTANGRPVVVDEVVRGKDTTIRFVDGTTVELLDDNAAVKLLEAALVPGFPFHGMVRHESATGGDAEIRVDVTPGSSFHVQTPALIGGVRGTRFEVKASYAGDEHTTTLSVQEGAVQTHVRKVGGEWRLVRAGESVTARVSDTAGTGDYVDGDAPTVTIESPTTSASYGTEDPKVSLKGSVSDFSKLAGVTWSNNRGGGGACSGRKNWAVKDIPLQSGTNVITVEARDAAGNTGTDTLTVAWVVPDAAAPGLAITSPTTEKTYETAAAAIALAGTASDPDGVAAVTWSNSAGGGGTATGTAGWSVPFVALEPGSNRITVEARDTSGNTTSAVLTVTRLTVDKKAPRLTIASPTQSAGYSTELETLSLAGTASDDFGVVSVTWSNDRGGNGTAGGTTNWSAADVPLLAGTNTITVTARDAAGNTATDTLSVTCTPVDDSAPEVAIAVPVSWDAYETSQTNLYLSGSASDPQGVAVVWWRNDRGGSGSCSGTTNWSASDIALQAGTNVITIEARDPAGNIGTDTLAVTLNQALTVQIVSPASGGTLATDIKKLRMSGTAGGSLELDKVTWRNAANGKNGSCTGVAIWETGDVELAPGTNVVTVTALAKDKTTATSTLTFEYSGADASDTEPAVIRITSPVASGGTYTTADKIAVLSGTAVDNRRMKAVKYKNLANGDSGACVQKYVWTTKEVKLGVGQNVVQMEAEDEAGHKSYTTITVIRQ
jgi:hypothetical protein